LVLKQMSDLDSSDLTFQAVNKPFNQVMRQSRVRFGVLLGLAVLALLMLGGWYWMALVVVGCCLGFLELDTLMRAKGTRPSRITFTMAACSLFPIAALGLSRYFSPMLTAIVLISFFRLLFRKPVASMGDIGATLMSVLYVVYLPMHFILLRDIGVEPGLPFWQQPGFGFVLMTLSVISASDIAAYYAGKSFGKHLLYPEISPKKTQEGALFGVLAGVATGTVFAQVMQLPLEHGVILSLMLTVVGQLGDLSESLLKRDAGMKDSGVLLAGHGGLLDRIDSYIFSGAVSYYYIYWVIMQEGLAKDLQHLLINAS
jgi:phosphatidate cytidylyltransferase